MALSRRISNKPCRFCCTTPSRDRNPSTGLRSSNGKTTKTVPIAFLTASCSRPSSSQFRNSSRRSPFCATLWRTRPRLSRPKMPLCATRWKPSGSSRSPQPGDGSQPPFQYLGRRHRITSASHSGRLVSRGGTTSRVSRKRSSPRRRARPDARIPCTKRSGAHQPQRQRQASSAGPGSDFTLAPMTHSSLTKSQTGDPSDHAAANLLLFG
jgi:hypothetical protein